MMRCQYRFLRFFLVFLVAGSLFACASENGGTLDDGWNAGLDGISFEDTTSSDGIPGITDIIGPSDASEDIAQDTSVPEPDTGGNPNPGVDDTINEGWIGGACMTDSVCAYEDSFCLSETETDLPGGMCSQSCDLYCPDQDGAVMTFCVNGSDLGLFDSDGYCTMRCDYAVSASGCRPGYECVSLPRHNDPATVVPTCVPGSGTEPPDPPTGQITNCQQELMNRGVGFTLGVNNMDSPAGHPNIICDVQDPIWIEPTIHGVTYRYASVNGAANSIYTSCELALAIEETSQWLAEQNVTDVIHLGVYNCRLISGLDPPTLSEHGLANAIDISGFRNADGSVYTVINDWELNTSFPVSVSGSFLKWFVETVFENWIFNVILTPDFNAAHHDHFHCDLTPGAHFLQ